MSMAPSLAEMLRVYTDTSLADVHTCFPASVRSYNATKQEVEVQPQIKRVVPQGNEEEDEDIIETPAPIPSVPVLFPRGGGFFCSFPLKEGDFGLVVVTESSFDVWRDRGVISHPGDLRQHDLSFATFIPCNIYPTNLSIAEASADKMVVGHDEGMQMRIDNGGLMELAATGAAMQALALATKVEAELEAIKNAYNNHIHITTATVGPTPIPGVLQPPVLQYIPGPGVGSSKIKGEE